MKGIQLIKVKVKFLESQTDEELRDFMENIDYDFNYGLISHSELKDFERNDNFKDIIYLYVAIYFELDLDDDDIQVVISEMDYEFKLDKIEETEIVELLD